MKTLLIALVTSLALVTQGAEPANTHRLEIPSKPGWLFSGEISGTYEIKNGSLEIQIKRGYLERTNMVTRQTKRHVTGLFLAVTRMVGGKPTMVAKGDKIAIDKVLEVGDKVRLKPQTVIIKDPSITPANAEKQWISAEVENEVEGSPGYTYGLDDTWFYGTKEKVSPSRK